MKIEHLYLFLKIVALLLLQVWVFNDLYLFRYATPYPYLMVLMLLPIATNKLKTTLLGGVVGLLLDILSGTPGLHTAALTGVGFLHNYLLRPFIDSDSDTAYPLSFRKAGGKAAVFLLELVVLHHLIFFGLDAMASFNARYFFIRLLSSIAITYLIAFTLLVLLGGGRKEAR